jgi:hypothetical protein
MKKLIFAILLNLFFLNIGLAQELSINSKLIREKYNYEYEYNFKHYAVKEWGEDYAMVLFEINRQSDSFIELINKLKSEHLSIFKNAILEWSREGYKEENLRKIREEGNSIFIMSKLIKLKTDWSMVKFEYDRQVKAKESF